MVEVDDFADRVRAAQQARSALDEEKRAERERELDAEREAQERITRTAGAMAQALTVAGVAPDVALIGTEHVRRKKLFGGWDVEVRSVLTLRGWAFAGRVSEFRDPESRFDRVEKLYAGYILATDGEVHTCNTNFGAVNVVGGVMEIGHRDPWGSQRYTNGPLTFGVLRTHVDAVLDGLVQLAVEHHLDPGLLPP